MNQRCVKNSYLEVCALTKKVYIKIIYNEEDLKNEFNRSEIKTTNVDSWSDYVRRGFETLEGIGSVS